MIATLAYVVLLACCALCLYRIGRDPPRRTAPWPSTSSASWSCASPPSTHGSRARTTTSYVGIAWAILSFIGAIALAKHLEGKGFDE